MYFHEAQYPIAREIMGNNALKREYEDEVWSMFICTDCGNIKLFKIPWISDINVFFRDGKIQWRSPLGFPPEIELSVLIDILREKGINPEMRCYECDGLVIFRKDAHEVCKKSNCPGCILCGNIKSKGDFTSIVRTYDKTSKGDTRKGV